MRTRISPTLVGLFVLGALALGVVGLLSFGGVNFFSQPQRFVVYFDESIHGLDLGSPVKLRGVHIGRVVDLVVRYDEPTNRSVVEVTCELSRNKITDSAGGMVDVSSRPELEHLVSQGLRAQLGILGLATGLLFVELDFVNPAAAPAPPVAAGGRYAVVPSVPSAISAFQGNLTEILNDIKRIDFAALGRQAQQLLTEANRQLARADLPALAAQWERTGATLDALAKSPEIKSILGRLNEASARVVETLAVVEKQVDANGNNVQATLRQVQDTLKTFNETAATVQRFVQAQGGVGDDLAAALRQVSDASAAVQRLAEFIERNPNALIYGRRPETK